MVDQAVGDQPRRRRGVGEEMPVPGLLALGEPWLPAHRGVDLLHQEGVAGVVGAHLHVLDVRLAETGLLEQHVQIELRHGSLGERHRLALEIGDRADVVAGEDAVGAQRLGQREHAGIGLLRVEIGQHVVGRGVDHIDLPGEQPGVHGFMDRHVDQLDLDPLLGEQALLLGDEQRPEPDPGQMADPQRLGLGRLAAARRTRRAATIPARRFRRSISRLPRRYSSRIPCTITSAGVSSVLS